MKKRLKMLAAALMVTTSLTSPAEAEPITLFVIAASNILSAIGVSVAATAVIGQAIAVSLSALAPTLLAAAASFAASALFSGDAAPTRTPPPQELQSNFYSSQRARYWVGGEARLGGPVILAEPKNGTLTKLVAHCDTEATATLQYYLNDIPVTLDGNGLVTNDEFSARGGRFFTVESRAGTAGQTAMQTLVDRFTEWTADHKGAGVCDTLLTVAAVPPQDRAAIYKHRGSLGLGEPDVTRAARYGRYYDPRNDTTQGGSGSERYDDPSTWGPNLGNLVLTIAAHRIDKERFAMDPADINWQEIAAEADIADETVIDRYGQTVKRYRGAVIIDKSEERNIDAEDRMLRACDGKRYEDEDGKWFIRVGKYREPTLTLHDDDIDDIESAETDDGEKRYSHVYALYTEPAFAYKENSTAIWVNPDIWSDGDPQKTTKVTLHELLDHNTALRVVKAAAKRLTAKRVLSLIAGPRARRARRERFLRLSLSDAELSGVYEVASVAPDLAANQVRLTLVSTDAGNWDLETGEEGERPNLNITITQDTSITNIAPAGMNIQAAAVEASGGISTARFVASFTVPARPDYIVQIQYKKSTDTLWEEYAVRTEDGAGGTATVADGATYDHRWRIVTVGGATSDWSDVVQVVAVADLTLTGDFASVAFSSPAAGEVSASWTNPPDQNYLAARIYRADYAAGYGGPYDFGDATAIADEPGLFGQTDTWSENGLATGEYAYWIEPLNGSGLAGTRSGPHVVAVS